MGTVTFSDVGPGMYCRQRTPSVTVSCDHSCRYLRNGCLLHSAVLCGTTLNCNRAFQTLKITPSSCWACLSWELEKCEVASVSAQASVPMQA